MWKAVIVVAFALFGAASGVFWTVAAPALSEAGQFTRGQVVAMWIMCPCIRVIKVAWWLVPLLNGLLYGSIALAALYLAGLISFDRETKNAR